MLTALPAEAAARPDVSGPRTFGPGDRAPATIWRESDRGRDLIVRQGGRIPRGWAMRRWDVSWSGGAGDLRAPYRTLRCPQRRMRVFALFSGKPRLLSLHTTRRVNETIASRWKIPVVFRSPAGAASGRQPVVLACSPPGR